MEFGFFVSDTVGVVTATTESKWNSMSTSKKASRFGDCNK